MPAPIAVAAGILRNSAGKILLAKRHAKAHQGNLWEFPGGKVEPDETIEQALIRELNEELGIEVQASHPLISIIHHYSDRSVHLHALEVEAYTGEPQPLDGQPLQWLEENKLQQLSMPAADRPIINAIRLPSQYVITGDFEGQCSCLSRLDKVLGKGQRLIQLRAKKLSTDEYASLAAQAAELCKQKNASLMLNAEAGLARKLDCGLHLTSKQLMSLQERPLSRNHWVAASCHNRQELDHARYLGLDFVTLSPVAKTSSHPGAEPIRIFGFTQLAAGAGLPCYALGGQSPDDIPQIREAGGQGVAGISNFWP